MTVTVETPNGDRTGSGVFEVQSYTADSWLTPPEATGYRSQLYGEAVPVPLGGNRYLFASLKWPGRQRYEGMLLGSFADELRPLPPGKERFCCVSLLAKAKGIKVVPPKYYPVMVFFADRFDRSSIKVLRPGDLQIGAGESISKITIEIVSARVQYRLRELLPWMRSGYIGFIDPEVQNATTREHQSMPQWRFVGQEDFILGGASKAPNNGKTPDRAPL